MLDVDGDPITVEGFDGDVHVTYTVDGDTVTMMFDAAKLTEFMALLVTASHA